MELYIYLFFGAHFPFVRQCAVCSLLQYLTDPDDVTSPREIPMAGSHPDILPR